MLRQPVLHRGGSQNYDPSACKKPHCLRVTFSVWKAMFLREAVARLSAGRAAWLWLLLEPVFT